MNRPAGRCRIRSPGGQQGRAVALGAGSHTCVIAFLAMATFELTINGRAAAVEVAPGTPLLWVLRDVLGLTGTKFGCGASFCGACTVLVDHVPRRSCQVPVESLASASIVTVEGLTDAGYGHVQDAWVAEQVPQCGYCQSGQLVSAAALLRGSARPTDDEIDRAMAGVLCRCGTYSRIRRAIHRAAAAS